MTHPGACENRQARPFQYTRARSGARFLALSHLNPCPPTASGATPLFKYTVTPSPGQQVPSTGRTAEADWDYSTAEVAHIAAAADMEPDCCSSQVGNYVAVLIVRRLSAGRRCRGSVGITGIVSIARVVRVAACHTHRRDIRHNRQIQGKRPRRHIRGSLKRNHLGHIHRPYNHVGNHRPRNHVGRKHRPRTRDYLWRNFRPKSLAPRRRPRSRERLSSCVRRLHYVRHHVRHHAGPWLPRLAVPTHRPQGPLKLTFPGGYCNRFFHRKPHKLRPL